MRMKRFDVALVMAVIAGCGTKPAPGGPYPELDPRPDDAAIASITPDTAQGDRDEPDEPSEPSLPPEEPDPPPNAAFVVATGCRGSKLDLKELVRKGTCIVKARPQPLPPDILISVEPKPLRLASGATTTASIVLTNASKAEAILVLDHRCDRLTAVTYEMLAANGERVDLEEGGCGHGRGCGARASAFALPPNGQLRLAFPLVARKEKFDAECNVTRVKPVPKGAYDLKVYSGLVDAAAKIFVE